MLFGLGRVGIIYFTFSFGHRSTMYIGFELAHAFLPDTVPTLKQTRDLLDEDARRVAHWPDDAPQRRAVVADERAALRAAASAHFPLSEAEVLALFEEQRERVLAVHTAEERAVRMLQAAVSDTVPV